MIEKRLSQFSLQNKSFFEIFTAIKAQFIAQEKRCLSVQVLYGTIKMVLLRRKHGCFLAICAV